MPARALLFIAVSSQSQAEPDKVSLDEQERACRQWCADNNASVVGVLRVDGFSRAESDVVAALEEFAALGVTAYADLRRAWRARSFDVLVAYHSSRLGRSQSLYTYVVENTINAGAFVHCVIGGRIDSGNVEFGIALGGVAARGESRRFTEMTRVAKTAQVNQGLPWARPGFVHLVERDNRGKPIRLVVNPARLQIVLDAANLVIEGISWKRLPDELLARYGHHDGTGQPYHHVLFYRLFYSAPFWGHNWLHANSRINKREAGGVWSIWPDYRPPEGVLMFYNTHDPVLTGELADTLKAELRRRTYMARGRSGPKITRPFSRLVVCTHCGSMLVYNGTGMRCSGKYGNRSRRMRSCPAEGLLNLTYVRTWIQSFLSQFEAGGDLSAYLTGEPDEQVNLAALEEHITTLTRRIQLLTARLSEVDDSLVPDVNAQLITLARERTTVYSRIETERAQRAARQTLTAASERSIEAIAALGWAEFWQQDPITVNQTLHAVFGRWRIRAANGRIDGLIKLD